MLIMAQFEIDEFSMGKGIKMVHINVRSLLTKVQEIYAKYGFCDLIVITGRWLNISVPDSGVMLPDFVLIRQDRYKTDLKTGGAICIYIRNEHVVDHMDNHSEVTDGYEILCIKTKIRNVKPCHVLGIYISTFVN